MSSPSDERLRDLGTRKNPRTAGDAEKYAIARELLDARDRIDVLESIVRGRIRGEVGAVAKRLALAEEIVEAARPRALCTPLGGTAHPCGDCRACVLRECIARVDAARGES